MGSSPLTRGKFIQDLLSARLTGLIPAHAGKIRMERRSSSLPAAHPRSRGENRVPKFRVVQSLGSSPLTRGKFSERILEGDIPRLIPAHAGKMTQMCMASVQSRAHPRSRGENALMGMIYSPEDGSSPLTRGKCRRLPIRRRRRRLIPAHAGKMGTRAVGRASGGAHPRSRGENTS